MCISMAAMIQTSNVTPLSDDVLTRTIDNKPRSAMRSAHGLLCVLESYVLRNPTTPT